MSQILLKRSNTATNDAYTGPLGEITLDTQTRKLRIHDGVTAGGHVCANMVDIQAAFDAFVIDIDDVVGLEDALAAIDSTLGNHGGRIGTLETNHVKKDGSVAFTGDIDAGTNKVINVVAPTLDTDAANKGYVDTQVSNLGNVFELVGEVTPGTQGTPFDLTTLGQTDAGDYYTVVADGYVTDGVTTEYVKSDDGIAFTSTSYIVFDNTNTVVSGTTDYITVTGSTDAGYVVDVSAAFKSRMSAVEAGVQSITSGSTALVIDSTDPLNPIISVLAATEAQDGTMSAADKAKLNGLAKASIAVATAGTDDVAYMTAAGTRAFIEDGAYTIDCGTF